MRSLSRWNTTIRKWKEVSPTREVLCGTRTRTRFIGTPYVPLDPLAKWMMWLSSLAVVVMAVAMEGLVMLPYLVVGVPGALGTGVMIARMGGRDFSRVVALVYFLAASLVTALLCG